MYDNEIECICNYITTIGIKISMIQCVMKASRHVAISEVSAWADEATAPVAVVTGSSVKDGDSDTHAVIEVLYLLPAEIER